MVGGVCLWSVLVVDSCVLSVLLVGATCWWSVLVRGGRCWCSVAFGAGGVAGRAGTWWCWWRCWWRCRSQSTGVCKEAAFKCVPPRCLRCGCQPSYVVAVVVDILPWASGFVGVALCGCVAGGLVQTFEELSNVVVPPLLLTTMFPMAQAFKVLPSRRCR